MELVIELLMQTNQHQFKITSKVNGVNKKEILYDYRPYSISKIVYLNVLHTAHSLIEHFYIYANFIRLIFQFIQIC